MRRIETLAPEAATVQSYLRAIAKFPRLTVEQERELGRRFQQRSDEEALGALVESNLRFVVSYARRYRKLGVPFLDLIHEGNLGLLEGARHFDPERSESFVSHAAWWVRQSIMHLLSDTAGLAALQAQLEHAPALADVASDGELVDEEHSHKTRSGGDEPLGDRVKGRLRRDDETDLSDALPGLVMQEIEDDLMRDALVQQLESAMGALEPLERQVVRLRYGLHSDEALSIPLIADRMRLSRRRVRTLEARAIEKLRRGKTLRSYLN